MRNRDKKFIKRWEKIRSNSKRKYALLHGIIFGTINFLVLLIPLIIFGEYIPSEKFSLIELVIFIVQEYTYYLLIGLIVFFIVHVIGAHFTWERNENEYKKIIQENGTDEIKGGSLLSQKKKIILYISTAVIFIVLFIYFNLNSFPYTDSEILKNEVENYLMNKYDMEFVVTDDITRNGPWYYVHCYPKTDLNFLLFGIKESLKKQQIPI